VQDALVRDARIHCVIENVCVDDVKTPRISVQTLFLDDFNLKRLFLRYI